MPRLIFAISLAVFLGGVSCSTATPTSSAASPTSSPLPPQIANWNSYSSAEYGYSLRYPPNWFDIGSLGGPIYAHYFSNKQTSNGSLLQMGPGGTVAGVDADCQSAPGGSIRLISQANVIVGGVAAIRYVIERDSEVAPSAIYAITTVKPGEIGRAHV